MEGRCGSGPLAEESYGCAGRGRPEAAESGQWKEVRQGAFRGYVLNGEPVRDSRRGECTLPTLGGGERALPGNSNRGSR